MNIDPKESGWAEWNSAERNNDAPQWKFRYRIGWRLKLLRLVARILRLEGHVTNYAQAQYFYQKPDIDL